MEDEKLVDETQDDVSPEYEEIVDDEEVDAQEEVEDAPEETEPEPDEEKEEDPGVPEHQTPYPLKGETKEEFIHRYMSLPIAGDRRKMAEAIWKEKK
jgi:hypothetical protein